MNLYEIDSKIMEAFDKSVDPETGEILDAEAFEELDKLQMMKDEKIEGILLWIKNLKSDVEALKKEKQAFESRQKAAENKAESLKKYVSGILCGEKFKTDLVSVTWRKSKATEYNGDIFDLPEVCITRKEPEVNKTALKKLLESGKNIPGARIIEKQNIQIK